MDSTYCVIVDSREKSPLPRVSHLPLSTPSGTVRTVKVEWLSRPLETGDYALLGHERGHVFERKKGLRELHSNLLTADRDRFLREIERSRTLGRFTLLVESDPAALSCPVPGTSINPVQVRDALHRLLKAYTHVELWMVPGKTANQRRLISEWMVSSLILSAEGARRGNTRPVPSAGCVDHLDAHR